MSDHPTRSLAVKPAVLLFCVAALSVQGKAMSQDFCSQPVAPYCLDKNVAFDSKVQVDRCEKDLKNYENDVADYQKCIKAQLDNLHKQLSDARQRLEDAKKSFQKSND